MKKVLISYFIFLLLSSILVFPTTKIDNIKNLSKLIELMNNNLKFLVIFIICFLSCVNIFYFVIIQKKRFIRKSQYTLIGVLLASVFIVSICSCIGFVLLLSGDYYYEGLKSIFNPISCAVIITGLIGFSALNLVLDVVAKTIENYVDYSKFHFLRKKIRLVLNIKKYNTIDFKHYGDYLLHYLKTLNDELKALEVLEYNPSNIRNIKYLMPIASELHVIVDSAIKNYNLNNEYIRTIFIDYLLNSKKETTIYLNKLLIN